MQLIISVVVTLSVDDCVVSGVLKASRKVEVHFVDFGNREVVECENLRDIPAVILNELPVQAVACGLYGVEQAGSVSMWSPADVDTFSDTVYDQLLEVYFTHSQSSDGHCLVHLLKDQENINRKFLRLTNKLSRSYLSPVDAMAAGDASVLAKRSQNVASNSVTEKDVGVTSRAYEYEACTVGEVVNAVAAYVVSPAQFYLHKAAGADALETMMEQLNADCGNAGVSQALNVGIGQPCCALYSQDDRWYRAKCASTSDKQRHSVTVDFVDYGNTDTVDASTIRQLPSGYFTLPVQALHCHLAGVVPTTGSDWSDDAAVFFEELLGDSTHSAKVVSVDKSVYKVEMKTVVQKLIDRGFAKPTADAAAAAAAGTRPAPKVVETSRGPRQHETQQLEMKKPSSWDTEPSAQMPRGGSGGFATERTGTDSTSSAPVSFSPMNVTADVRHSVMVSWVVSPSEFYCQLIDNCRVIEKLSSELRKTYQSAGERALSASDCTVGRCCVAFYEPDRSWYRARIVSRSADQLTVFYVDYGNTEVVRVGQVKQPAAQFVTSPPVQAIKCCLRVADRRASEWTKDEISTFDKAVSAPSLTCKFLDKRDDVYIVELSDQTGRDLAALFGSAAVSGAAAGAAAVSVKADVKTYIYECGLKEKDVVQLEVVYVADSSTVFNCHVVGQTDELDELMAKLADDCQRRPALTSFPDSGQPCAALYSEDNGWYRATVDSIPSDNAEHRIVKFVDYGNIESCPVSSLRELDARFLHVPVRRVDCRLQGMTATSLDDVIDDLLALHFTAAVVAVDSSKVVTVDLKTADTGESFASTHEELFVPSASQPPGDQSAVSVPASQPPRDQSAVSLPASQPPCDEVDVYVTHVVSPSDFYIQMASVESQLTELADQLMEHYESSDADELKLPDVTVGSLCCARYSADEAWYRAVVEDVSTDTVSVRFVDYGNTDVISQADVRRVTDRFTTIPACAWHCQLAVDSAQPSSDAQQQKFVELTEAGEKVFSCSFVSRSQSPYRVNLKDGEVDIGQLLYGSVPTVEVPSTELAVTVTMSDLATTEPPSELTEVCITSAESPSDFYVQLTSVEDELSQLADELTTEYDSLSESDHQLTTVDVGNLGCARYSADSAWYRAVIIDVLNTSEVRVLFIDYGNTDVVSVSTDLKLLHEKFCTKPAFVYHCALQGLRQRPTEDWSDEVKTKFTELTVTEDEMPAVFSCQFVSHDADTGRYLVSLKSADDVDVCGMFADVSDAVTGPVEDHQMTGDQKVDTAFQPVAISPGKHTVSSLSASHAVYVCFKVSK